MILIKSYLLVLISFSSLALVGGMPALPFDGVFIWTNENVNLKHSYCTGSKIGERYILTAAHCVLSQRPVSVDAIYWGPWLPSLKNGARIKYSFSRDLKSISKAEYLTVKQIHLPAQVLECVESPDKNLKKCQGRVPLPDLAVIEVEQEDSVFSQRPILDISRSDLKGVRNIVVMGYGSECNVGGPEARLKFSVEDKSSWSEVEKSLAGTYADVDGYPSRDYFFGLVSSINLAGHVNLGGGDSGGPVLDFRTFKIIGVNSDGFCPIGKRGCEETNNSLFAKIDLEFLKKFLR
jgi:hypothetical protein